MRILTVRVAWVLGGLLGGDGDGLELVDAVEDDAGSDEERPHGLDDGGGVCAETEESHCDESTIGGWRMRVVWCGIDDGGERLRCRDVRDGVGEIPHTLWVRPNARIERVLLAPERESKAIASDTLWHHRLN